METAGEEAIWRGRGSLSPNFPRYVPPGIPHLEMSACSYNKRAPPLPTHDEQAVTAWRRWGRQGLTVPEARRRTGIRRGTCQRL